MAVYTEVGDEDLKRFIASYDIGELLSYKGIAEGVENTNYIVHTTSGPYILTLYEKRVSQDDLPFFLGLMEHLAQSGVSCPPPLRDRNGNNLNPLSGRTAALVTFIEGFWVRKPQPHHCRNVGAAMAALHLAGQSFKQCRPNTLSIEGWRPLFEKVATNIHQIDADLKPLIEKELQALHDAWPRDLPTGVIHADLFPDNVFFIGDDLSGLIDFYFACTDALSYDIAIGLNAWCFDPDYSFNVTKGAAFLSGYEAIRPLSDPERAAMPTLARGAAMRFLLTRCYDWLNTPANAVVSPHDPLDYVSRLRFHQSVKSIADYNGEAA